MGDKLNISGIRIALLCWITFLITCILFISMSLDTGYPDFMYLLSVLLAFMTLIAGAFSFIGIILSIKEIFKRTNMMINIVSVSLNIGYIILNIVLIEIFIWNGIARL